MQAILQIALHSADMRQRTAALKVLQAFCTANNDGQQILIKAITTPFAAASQTGQSFIQCLSLLVLSECCCSMQAEQKAQYAYILRSPQTSQTEAAICCSQTICCHAVFKYDLHFHAACIGARRSSGIFWSRSDAVLAQQQSCWQTGTAPLQRAFHAAESLNLLDCWAVQLTEAA